jgi:carboxypeptidase Q
MTAATLALTLFCAAPAAISPPVPVDLAGLAGEALVTQGAYELARGLADGVGARPAGSAAAARATEWAETAMKSAGLELVRREPVKSVTWIRGPASGALIAPVSQPLVLTALGGSVGTKVGGLDAEVVAFDSFEALRAGVVTGKIVLCDKVMDRTVGPEGYIAASGVRRACASIAGRLGAVAALVRSAGTGYHRLAHTGALGYAADAPRIPAAALAWEDADLIRRLLRGGEPVRMHLAIETTLTEPQAGWNVVGELAGTDRKNEIVVVGAHLDSWDVGPGALDDAAGCGLVLDVVRNLRARRLRPRRTVRVVLFTDEELGGSGALAYAEAHKGELPRHVAALEADSGAGPPLGYRVAGTEAALALVRGWTAPLGRLIPARVSPSPAIGADIMPLQRAGVPVLGIEQDLSDYFVWHHTAADTVDKIDRLDYARASAALTTLVWQVASSDDRLPPPTQPAPPKPQ